MDKTLKGWLRDYNELKNKRKLSDQEKDRLDDLENVLAIEGVL